MSYCWAVSLIRGDFPLSQSHTHTHTHTLLTKIEQVSHENDDVVPDENCITNDKNNSK